MNLQSAALLTKGMIGGGGVPLISHGYIITISDFVYVPTEPPRRKGGSIFGGKRYEPKKIIEIAVWAYGQIYTETIIVNAKTKVTLDNVKVTEIDGNITIEVIDVKTY